MIHDLQNTTITDDPAVKWLRRAAWLLLIVMTIADVTVTFGSSLGIHSRWF
jgi:hypothetical protein